MRHRIARHRFNRRTAWRTATVKAMVQGLFTHETIQTTLTRAKATQPLVEKLISWGKTNTLEKKRLAYAVLGDHLLVKQLFGEIAPRFKARSSGFTRILRLANRRGDDAQIVLFQLTQLAEKPKAEAGKKKGKEPKASKEAKEAKETGVIDVTPAKEAEDKHKVQTTAPEKPEQPREPAPKKTSKPSKKFLGGIRGIFKKERDSL